MPLLLNGIGVSRGIGLGKTRLLKRGESEVFEYSVPAARIEREVSRFRKALERACDDLRAVRSSIPEGNVSADISGFIDMHLLMLEDGPLTNAPVNLIRGLRCNAEWALKLQRDELVEVFDRMEDPYLRTRRADIDQVIQRIQRALSNEESPSHGLDANLQDRIIVADDLTPADTVVLQNQRIAGFITESGGPLSHTAILARSLGIPAVVGLHEARTLLREDEQIVLDGTSGMVLAGADRRLLRDYRRRRQELRRQHQKLTKLRDQKAITRDGHRISLQVNIEVEEDIRALRLGGAEGVGLYRTEFLYLDRDQPADEAEQFNTYRRVVRILRGRSLTIRTLDLGADKEFDPAYTGVLAPNPALGLRAIRRCLKDTRLFIPQLRAIMRASALGPVRMMIPMLSSYSELQQTLELIAQVKGELREENLVFDPDVPVGAMIEVPAAALSAHAFARKLDFLSIGTNDLIQYTLAIDRIDDEVNYLYDPLHPAVLRLIYMVLQAGRRAGIPVSMCGEMAGEPRYTRLLLGLGLRDFSAHPANLLEVKQVINDSSIERLTRPCRRVLNTADAERIAALVDGLNGRS